MVRIAGVFAALVVLAGTAVPVAAQDKAITVFAAASMKNAVDDIGAAFTKATGIKAVASLAASSALAKQIEQGAPADFAYWFKDSVIHPKPPKEPPKPKPPMTMAALPPACKAVLAAPDAKP